MAIQTNNLISQLSPLSALNIGGGGSDYGLEQLKLQREQFEEQKRQAALRAQYEAQAEAGRMARHQLTQERLAEEAQRKLEAEQAKAQQEKRIAAYNAAMKYADEGNFESMQQLVPLMTQLGMGIQLQGTDENGLPRYQIDMDAEQAAAQASQDWERGPHPIDQLDGGQSAVQSLDAMSALGYPTNETGALEDDPRLTEGPGLADESVTVRPELSRDPSVEDAVTPGANDYQGADEIETVDVAAGGLGPASLSAGDPYARALASQGRPARPADPADMTGAIPNNVIDFGAQRASALRRLDPALAGFAAAYPEGELQGSAQQTAQSVRGLGLSPGASVETFQRMRAGPDAAYNTLANRQAQQERFDTKREELTEMERSQLQARGRQTAGDSYNKLKVGNWAGIVPAGKAVRDSLTNDVKADDSFVFQALMNLQGVKGTPSDADLNLILGIPLESKWEQAVGKVKEWVEGGMNSVQKEAILGYVEQQSALAKDQVFQWFDAMQYDIDDPALSEHERHAIQGFRDRVARSTGLYDEWQEKRQGEMSEEQAPPGQRASVVEGVANDFEDELLVQASERGLNGDYIRRIIGGESGGDPKARNAASGASGVFQILNDKIARSVGTTLEALRGMTAEEQLPYGLEYFASKGLTAQSPFEDYVMAQAAPAFIGKPRDAKVYVKGSNAWRDNPGWRPADGGDITVGSIVDYYSKQRGGSAPAAAAGDPNARAAEILQKLRGGR